MKLLTIQNDHKTVKGEAYGYITAVMYLAPYDLSGQVICPFAKQAKCHVPCLNRAGRGVFDSVQQARLNRTMLYHEDRMSFMSQLVEEITAFLRKAKREGLTPAVRLNGTSDILWEHQALPVPFPADINIFQMFPDEQFYDYTKVYKRPYRTLPANYHLTLSYSEASLSFADKVYGAHEDTGANLAVVVRNNELKQQMLNDYVNCIDGDLHDLRFKDEPNSLVLLTAKGPAKQDDTGFVLDEWA